MLTGEYFNQLDEKGRLRIPAKLCKELGSEVVIMRGSNKCLYVYPKSLGEQILQSVFTDDDIFDEDEEKLRKRRKIHSSSDTPEVDKQGRIVIKSGLAQYAHLTKNVVTIGSGTRVEIWDADLWNEYNAEE